MTVSRTFVVKEVRLGAAGVDGKWNSGTGGPLSATVAHSGNPVISRTGSDLYPARISVQDRNVVVTVVLGEYKFTSALSGTAKALAIDAYYHEGTETVTLTVNDVLLYEVRSTQNRANPSETALTFICVPTNSESCPLS